MDMQLYELTLLTKTLHTLIGLLMPGPSLKTIQYRPVMSYLIPLASSRSQSSPSVETVRVDLNYELDYIYFSNSYDGWWDILGERLTLLAS